MLAVVTIAPATLLAACGSDGPDTPEDERVRQITGIAELAANAYAAVGAEGLYDYLASDVAASCSKDDLAQALADEPVPEGFVRVESVEFDGDDGRARVVQLVQDDGDTREAEAEWSFVLEDEDRWRITNMPGLERCVG